jgi:hypothetical protein
MRLLLTILCFIALQAQGQALFHAHNKATAAATPCDGVSDPNACAYLTATGIVDPTVKSAVVNLVASLKSNGLWAKMSAVYPLASDAGAEASIREQHRYNLKDTALYKLDMVETGYHSPRGMMVFNAGGVSRANTGLIPSDVLTLNSTHISYYSRTENNALSQEIMDMGAMSAAGVLRLYISWQGVYYADMYDPYGGRVSSASSSTQGFYVLSRTASDSFSAYRNGSTVASTTASGGGLPTVPIWIGAVNDNNSHVGYVSNREVAFATIGGGLSAAEVATLNTIVETFNDALSRGVQ